MSNPVKILSLLAPEEGTYAVDEIQFLDTDDSVITPNADTVTWCLTDKNKNIINGKEEESIDSEESMIVVLSGLDLAVSGEPDKIFVNNGITIKYYQRNLTVKGRVNSNIGNNLPSTTEFVFFVENIVCI